MKIANVSELRDGVNEVFVGSEKYFIHKVQGKIKIYSSICPHQGGRLFCVESSANSTNRVGENDEIYCKVHNWRFDASSGKSSNIQSAKLREVGFRVDVNGDIYLDLIHAQDSVKLEETSPICHSKSFSCHSERSEESQKNLILSEAKYLNNNQNRDSSVATLPQNDNLVAENEILSENPPPRMSF